jgi:hypothetical protein
MVMEEMQAVYDEEANGGSFGLMSLMRGTGDMVLGEDIMNNLPELLRAFEGTNLGTQEGLSEISRPMETEGFALELSTTPGLESMVGPEIGLALGALGGGGKGRSIKELLSGRGMEGFQNMKEGLLDERATDYFKGPEGLKAINIDRRNIQRMMDEDPKVQPREMASGGRPGLYANINAKRKRIAAGSGETMRKKGDKGAPTAANFRESAKTAKKANGGGLSYMNGYYGKSYK